MPFINGTFKRGYNWIADAAAGIANLASRQQADAEDIAGGLSLAILRDGTGIPTSDLPMGNHTITGIRKAVAAGEAVEFSQLATAGGSVSNLLQNASLNINQRALSGTVTLAANAYGHDRWKAGASGCTYTFTPSGADTIITITAGSLVQVVAGTDVDAGIFTLSNGGTAQARAYQGGSASAPSLSASPVTTGTLAAGAPVFVEFGPGSIFEPQFEAGTTVHKFVRRPSGVELALCIAYYERQTLNLVYYVSGAIRIPIVWVAPKAAVPSVTVVSTSNPFNATVTATNISAYNVMMDYNGLGTGGPFSWAGTVTASCEP